MTCSKDSTMKVFYLKPNKERQDTEINLDRSIKEIAYLVFLDECHVVAVLKNSK